MFGISGISEISEIYSILLGTIKREIKIIKRYV